MRHPPRRAGGYFAERKGKPVIRLLSVDDHAIVRDGVVRLIARQPDMKLIAEASDVRRRWNSSASISPMLR